MSKQNLAKNIRELRTRKGLSQELLAEKSKVSLRTVQRIENGETETPWRYIDPLVGGVGCGARRFNGLGSRGGQRFF